MASRARSVHYFTRSISRLLSGLTIFTLGLAEVAAQNALPLPCGGGNCGEGGPQVFVSSGEASYRTDGSIGTINQLSDRVILNWESFNVADGSRVVFNQPRDISVALNRIFDQSPSQILGAVDANGQVYLVNPNGFMFGENSRVNTNTLLASALNITDEVFTDTGLVGAIQTEEQLASLVAFEDADGEILIEAGAELRTAEGGRIMLFAPRVVNNGRLETPGGQTLIGAADERVYLQFSQDSDLRGLVVELVGEGEARNLGEIVAERGNITIAGLLLEQQGVLRATTSLDENGSIDLQAKNGVDIIRRPRVGSVAIAADGGTLTVGPDSVTEVVPDTTSNEVAIDSQQQVRSRISLLGKTIEVGERAVIKSTGGIVDITATINPGTLYDDRANNDSSLLVAENVVIDASGTTDTLLPMSVNQVDLELRGNELADSPQQRDGVIRGESVSVDRRVGSSLANVDDAIANIGRGVGERLAPGGDIRLRSEGQLSVADGAVLDISGGSVRYEDGFVESSRLIRGSEVIDIANADPDVVYDGVFRGTVKQHPTWGVTETFADPTGMLGAQFEAGYVEGKDAGSLLLQGPSIDLQASVAAGVTTGRHQRLPSSELGDTVTVNRPFEELARGGATRILTQSNVIVSTAAAAQEFRAGEVTLGADAGDPVVLIESEALGESGLGQLVVDSQQDVEFSQGVQLELAAGAAVDVDAENIRFDASLRAPGGSVSLAARTINDALGGTLTLAGTAELDVSGRWVNDFAFRNDPATQAILLDGGSIELRAGGNLVVDTAAQVSANGGAWLTAERQLVDGKGGVVSVIARPNEGRSVEFQPPSQLNAFALEQGGELHIEGPTFALIQQDVPPRSLPLPPTAGSSIINPEPPIPGLDFISDVDLLIPSALLRNRGFEEVALTSNDQALVVVSGQRIQPLQLNFLLLGGAERLASADTLALSGAARVGLLPDHERRPAHLRLAYASITAGGAPQAESGLIVQPGARIQMEPLGHLTLESSASLWLDDAELIAPGGQILLKTGDPLETGLINFAQTLRIGAGSLIDVGGVFLPRPNSAGLRLGSVLPGGSITADARMGWLIVEGARDELTLPQFNLAGGTAVLDIASANRLGVQATEVAAHGGQLDFRAAEGGVVQGAIVGRVANDAAAATLGASVSVTIDANNRRFDEVANANAPVGERFTADERLLSVVANTANVDFAYGEAVPETFHAKLQFDSSAVEFAGVDSLDLNALASTFRSGLGSGQARIEFSEDSDISVAESLRLSAPALSGLAGVDVALAAAYVALGDRRINPQGAAELGAAGEGRFSVNADTVDLIGQSSISGFEQLLIDSTNSVRLSGVLDNFGTEGRALVGGLSTEADVTIRASDVLVTSATSFDLQTSGSLVLANKVPETEPGSLFSYGGSLVVTAEDVYIATRLSAPGGQININANNSLVLDETAELSTRLDELLLYGELQAGLDWIYSLPNANVRLLEQLPESRISLSGESFRAHPGSSIDTSGGGDLLAWEFVAGPGGTQDYLRAGTGRFALLPAEQLSAAPVDPSLPESAVTQEEALRVGRRVVLEDTPLLAAGSYVLLPARYALLPGAVLVEPVADLFDLLPGEVRRDADGVAIIGGRLAGLGGAWLSSNRTQGFRLIPQSFANQNSEYRIATANRFFADRTQVRDRTLEDAGSIDLRFTTGLDLEGRLIARGANGGLSGALSLVANELLVADSQALSSETVAALDGVAILDAADLSSFEVGTVVVGGRLDRDSENNNETLSSLAQRVEIASETSLQLADVVLAAREQLTVGDNVKLETTGAGLGEGESRQVRVDSESAILWLSNDTLQVVRDDLASNDSETEVAGRVALADTAELNATGSLVVQAPSGGSVDAALRAPVADVLAGDLLLVEERPGPLPESPDMNTTSTVLDNSQLVALGTERLSLRSTGGLQISGVVQLGSETMSQLTLAGTGLLGSPGSELEVQAEHIQLFGSQLETRGAPASPDEPLQPPDEITPVPDEFERSLLSGFADTVEFGGGVLALEGFDTTELLARSGIVTNGEGGLSGDGVLAIDTPFISSSGGASTSLSTTGELRVRGVAGAELVPTSSALGAQILLAGANVELDTLLHAPSGRIDVRAVGSAPDNDSSESAGTGSIRLGNLASLDTAGISIRGNRTLIDTPGGIINLDAVGSISAATQAALDVSGPLDAGAVTIRAGGVAQLGNHFVGDAAQRGADFQLTADSVDQFASLFGALQRNGFTGDRRVLSGSGDLVLGAEDLVTVTGIELVSEEGAVAVAGRVELMNGGRAAFAGKERVDFSGSLVGEDVTLLLESMASGAELAFSGSAVGSGEVILSTLAENFAGNPQRVQLNTTGVDDGFSAALELVTTANFGEISPALNTDATTTSLQAPGDSETPPLPAPTVLDASAIAALGEQVSDAREALEDLAGSLPDVELHQALLVQAPGDLLVQDDLDLSTWSSTLTGRLILRAREDLQVNATISDGFSIVPPFNSAGLSREESWGIVLAAGASGQTASSLSLGLDTRAADISFADGAYVRTGTGDIDVRVTGDLVMDAGASALYSAGRSVGLPGFDEDIRFLVFHDIELPEQGGDIRVNAGGNIRSQAPVENITDYMVRLGGSPFGAELPVMAGVTFNRFQPTGQVVPAFNQGIGSFGGGNIDVRAGGFIDSLTVVAPELFRHTGDATGVLNGSSPVIEFTDNSFERLGSEQVVLSAGGAIDGGLVYVGSGNGRITADEIGPGGDGLGLLLAQSSSQVSVDARGDIRIAGVIDPYITTQSLGSLPAVQSTLERIYYFSYTDDTSTRISALGDLGIGSAVTDLANRFVDPGVVTLDTVGLNVYPGSLELTSGGGEVALLPPGSVSRTADLLLYPSPNGGVKIAAVGDIRGPSVDVGGTLLVSDADAELLPSPNNPQESLAQVEARLDTSVQALSSNIHARVPVHIDDNQPSVIESIGGSVDAPGLSVVSAEALDIEAAQTLSLSAFDAQNVSPDDVSSLSSGEDIRLLANRNPNTGAVSGNSRVIRLAGPGTLEIIAGGSVDLGTSTGIETVGDLENPSLENTGADVLVLTGATGQADYTGFFNTFIAEQDERRAQFAEAEGVALDSPAAAVSYFAQLPASRQRPVVVDVLFEELNNSGLLASQLIAQEAPAADVELAYAGGEAAVALLFPEGSDFSGDLSLFFSKIQTLDGGDIDLLVPGGGVNVGLTVGFGAEKSASELGIVAQGDGNVRVLAQGDIEVNRSRIFTLNGGDISLWSVDGDIDAGRGAKTALATPALTASLGENDSVQKVLPPAVSGSGIAADDGTSGRLPDILLSTPNGIVDAGDAGIRTPGRLFTAAVDVVGRDNIDAGSFVGAPADTVVLSADLASVGDSAASATQDLAAAVTTADQESRAITGSADAALGWLEVFLEGFGPEFCDPKIDGNCGGGG